MVNVKKKGNRVEYKIVKLFEKEGYKARRQPMSGAILGLPHDVVVKIDGIGELNIEVKARKGGSGFKTINNWLGSAHLLALVEDFEEPKFVMTWTTLKRILEPYLEDSVDIASNVKR